MDRDPRHQTAEERAMTARLAALVAEAATEWPNIGTDRVLEHARYLLSREYPDSPFELYEITHAPARPALVRRICGAYTMQTTELTRCPHGHPIGRLRPDYCRAAGRFARQVRCTAAPTGEPPLSASEQDAHITSQGARELGRE